MLGKSYLAKIERDQAVMQKEKEKPKQTMVLDGVVYDSADEQSANEMANLKLEAASIVASFAETSDADLEEGETLADRLDALVIGVADDEKDGDLDDDEIEIANIVYGHIYDSLINKGVEDSDVDALVNDGDEAAAVRVRDLLVDILPSDGADAEMESINSFAFDKESDEAVLDAVYKKKMVIRNGKKMRVRKRISGRVKLSSAQRQAIKKARRKAFTGAARMKRMKSMRKHRRMIG